MNYVREREVATWGEGLLIAYRTSCSIRPICKIKFFSSDVLKVSLLALVHLLQGSVTKRLLKYLLSRRICAQINK